MRCSKSRDATGCFRGKRGELRLLCRSPPARSDRFCILPRHPLAEATSIAHKARPARSPRQRSELQRALAEPIVDATRTRAPRSPGGKPVAVEAWPWPERQPDGCRRRCLEVARVEDREVGGVARAIDDQAEPVLVGVRAGRDEHEFGGTRSLTKSCPRR